MRKATRSRKRKPLEDPQVMCGLCHHTEEMWLSQDAPPQVIFDTLSCLVTNLVIHAVVYDQRHSAIDYITKTAKDMVDSKRAGAKGLN
jgi:hypothetical protein